MRRLIFILIIVNASAFASVHSVYNRLLRATGEQPLPLSISKKACKMENGQYSIACTDGYSIQINSKALKYVQNDHELAGIIGHEMGHKYYHDEMKADVTGLNMARKAGYNYCKGAQFLKGMMKDAEHPSGMTRYQNSGCK